MTKKTDSLKDHYDQFGYAIGHSLLDDAEVQSLVKETITLCRGERGLIKGAHSPDHIAGLNDNEVQASYLAIHFPHKLSPLIAEAMKHPAIVDCLKRLIGPNVKAMQSMLFMKYAGKPGQAWHQDEYYIPTRDRSLCGAWIALDDATIDNGCLWIHPGSHRKGIIWPTRDHQDAEFDISQEAWGFPEEQTDGIPAEVKAGDVVFFNGYTLHHSLPNRSAGNFRRALVNHYMSAESLLPWQFGGKPRNDFRDIVMVCGDDPYAWKGLESLSFGFLRKESKASLSD